MHIGITASTNMAGTSVVDIVQFARDIEQRGFHSLWLSQVLGLDALTVLGLVAHETHRLIIGSAVVPSYPRHPTALAQQALTIAHIANGRFTLGLGLSHKVFVEDKLGLSYEQPARHMSEYLKILCPLLEGKAVDYKGRQYSAHLSLDTPDSFPVPVLLAALGPSMLRLAGRRAAGITTWMAGLNTLEHHLIPSVRESAADAGQRAPYILAGMPIVLTDNAKAAKAQLSKSLAAYGQLPSYQRMLALEGVDDPADIALVGDKYLLRDTLQRLQALGVTEFRANIVPSQAGEGEETLAFLQEYA